MTEPYEFVEPLSDEKSERLINLVLLLRSSARGFTKAEIFNRLLSYRADINSDNAAMMFERDKAELIRAGIAIDVYQADAYTEDEFRYRINDDEALLPEIELTQNEISILSTVLQGWKKTIHRSDAIQAQLKLEGLGHSLTDEIPVLELTGNQHLSPLLQAISVRKHVSFEYIKPNTKKPDERKLQPWGVLLRAGQWFVYGFDVVRGADRVFNLNRIASDVKISGTANSFELPTDLNLNNLFQPHLSQEKTTLTLRIAEDNGNRWRQSATAVLTNDASIGDIIQVDVDNLNLEIPLLAAAAPGVVVLEPLEVRDKVRKLVMGEIA